jgi:hypothetical protein
MSICSSKIAAENSEDTGKNELSEGHFFENEIRIGESVDAKSPGPGEYYNENQFSLVTKTFNIRAQQRKENDVMARKIVHTNVSLPPISTCMKDSETSFTDRAYRKNAIPPLRDMPTSSRSKATQKHRKLKISNAPTVSVVKTDISTHSTRVRNIMQASDFISQCNATPEETVIGKGRGVCAMDIAQRNQKYLGQAINKDRSPSNPVVELHTAKSLFKSVIHQSNNLICKYNSS